MIYSSSNPAQDMGNLKSFSARQIIQYYKNIGEEDVLRQLRNACPNYQKDQTHKFWQEGYCPKQMYSFDVLEQKIDYIHWNSVRKGYVDSPEKWKWSSANPDFGIEIEGLEY